MKLPAQGIEATLTGDGESTAAAASKACGGGNGEEGGLGFEAGKEAGARRG